MEPGDRSAYFGTNADVLASTEIPSLAEIKDSAQFSSALSLSLAVSLQSLDRLSAGCIAVLLGCMVNGGFRRG